MKFGVFDHMDSSGEPLRELFENRLRLAEAYDSAGFHALHVAEHHSTPLGMSPSPSIFLALVAQRTRRLRFGPLVYTLPLYHPLRLAEEICTLDHLSGGRLELGVGRGVSPLEVACFGVDPQKSQAMYLEAYQVLMQALVSRNVSFEGEHYKFRDTPVILEPVQKPHPPLWYGVFSPQSAEWPVSSGVNVVTNIPASGVRAITDYYRAEWVRLGKDPERIPLLGMNRHMVIADTDREAMDIGRRAYRRWFENFSHLWRKRNVPLPKNISYSEDFDGIVANGQAIAGSPRTVRDAIARQKEEAGVNYLLMRLAFGDMTLAESLRSVDLFAREVMPEFAAASTPVA
ncbi:MAG TPA: LLM class flavin-dependent oxidoreductase [Burkholderiales bacterium]|nr:LLM class flavin-dependent oxidoreductase [Burkholderiales bacterium]